MADVSDILSGFGAAASGIGALGTVISSKRAAKWNYEYGEKAANNAYQRQIDLWNMQNEYNNPASEVQRLKDAGLSVGAYYAGQSGGPAATASSVPENKSPGTREAVRGEGAIGNLLQSLAIRSQESEIDLKRSAAERNRAEAGLIPERRDYLKSQSDANLALGENTRARTVGQLLSNNLAQDTYSLNVENAGYIVQQNFSLMEQYIEYAYQASLESDFSRDTYDTRLELLETDLRNKAVGIGVQYAYIEALQSGVQLNEAQIDSIATSIETELLVGRASTAARTALTLKDVDHYTTRLFLDGVKTAAQTVLGALGIRQLSRPRPVSSKNTTTGSVTSSPWSSSQSR